MVRSLAELAEYVGAELRGDARLQIEGVATLQNAGPNQIGFLANSRYRRYLAESAAGAVVLAREEAANCKTNCLITKNPYLAFAKIATLLNPASKQQPGIAPSAVIAPGAKIDASAHVGANAVIGNGVEIGAEVFVGPNCVIEDDVVIGNGTCLRANVTLCRGVKIGRNGLIHPGVVIGGDGFGLANDTGRWVKVPQLGGVTLGDDVEVGANTTIDRGALGNTVIEEGVKLDNQIQVAHNVIIGAHTAIAGCVGIAGSTEIGKRCQIGGGVGIVGHLKIVDDVHITAMSLVTGNITKPGVYSSGTPLELNQQWHKNAVRFRQLDELARRIKTLERSLGKDG
ncbi:MAG: UDP-3-O-(3-hydroxymyristoyl)glucosamine N-acyltransferase [Gammaproteobacteria bacterium]|nr:UDP-3-O-(3-hydroxymyristoyl)glucosamine N-acyltransferase [Gammaproteobacteria bacterium]